MTELERLKEIAMQTATKTGLSYNLFRLPAWPEGVYGILAQSRLLPTEAIIAEVVKPPELKSGMLF